VLHTSVKLSGASVYPTVGLVFEMGVAMGANGRRGWADWGACGAPMRLHCRSCTWRTT